MYKEELIRAVKKFKANHSAMFGLFLLIFFVIIAIFSPILAPVEKKEDVNLKNIKKYLKSNNRDIIISEFNKFHQNMYNFYLMHHEKITNLENIIIEYENGNLTETRLTNEISILVNDYIIDDSYLKDWKEDNRSALKKIFSEIDTYKVRYNKAINIKNIIDSLKPGSSNFYKEAKRIYRICNRIYKSSVKINPYIIPTVTWSLSPKSPSKKNLFGISNGKDIYYGVIWGARTAFKIGFLVVFFSTLIGLIIGSIAGFYGKWVEELLMRVTDIFMSVPFMLSAIVLTTILGSGLDKVMIAMIVFGWMTTARLIRGNILQAKNDQYILASKALGVSDFKIIVIHLLPNTIFPVVVQASMRIGSVVITSAALSFLGLGAPLGYADWGSILSYARNWIMGSTSNPFQYWYLVFFPGLAMVLFVLSWNLVGDALRDIFDPKLRI